MNTAFISTALVMLLACFAVPTACSQHNHGVDDWTAEDFGRYIREDTSFDVPTSAILAIGLDGSSFFAVSDVNLSSLLLQPSQQAVVRQSLDKLFNRANTEPVDFWEWRSANRRLSDNWIVPLAISPRALLIWSRFFDSSSAIDHIRGSIDEPGALMFWLQWLLAPHYQLYLIASKAFDSHTYYDDIIQFVYAFGVLVDVILAFLHFGRLNSVYARILCVLKIGPEASDVQFLGQLALLALTLLWALFCYYVLWRILPLPFNNMLFDVHISIVIPVMILGSFYTSHVIAARYSRWATPQKKYY